MSSESSPEIIQWLVDTRKLWPEVAETKQLETFPSSSRALSVLPDDERTAVLKYVFARDAKMSLASHLLKHYVVSSKGHVPWKETTITRNARTKPVYVDPNTGRQPVAFNVTHQAGIVALVAVAGDDSGDAGAIDVGIDVVCTSERRTRDHSMIAQSGDGWARFVDMHADVFAPAEANYLKFVVPGQAARLLNGTSGELVDYNLRSFYTLWCLREAYVKMTGEALLASWLCELEFRDFNPPPIPSGAGSMAGSLEGDDEAIVRDHEIWFQGKLVDDANVCLRALGPDYMVCTAMRTPAEKEKGLGWDMGPFKVISIDEIVKFAEEQ
ncbi:hypothetical protein MGG_17878 [Pyricularia oryzae 70-15]|uniref:holo-[acyl-carrier-protein] synthase n=3 Tax=Pyricularia oryzae TaxID=318829 RepID=G5EHE5_PYRO7|nr:uncharacterized protein MGG_17878 [Pyricularia oryzae 70-15]ELQ42986.1 phosphopantetheinyl transferase [Pyricularia oryzae Y34]KAI7912389.1 hypothetical protein M9X92_010057 [Pyricularia oryzae]EAQ71433.1 hypothetical protein MGCH7_ch7g840 [Pyricularia oryzae 70-15]EHA45892.1 hypothetical protein MGG_17878 [Pyricularia oryzae 70-15]KAI7913299.1 hypothetical protein M0657_010071 [Pyricularia oryzae]